MVLILNEEDEADTVYLLAKELAYDVVTGQTDKLTAALAKTSGKDFVNFAKTLNISHSNIDGKICETKPGKNGNQGYGVYGQASAVKDSGSKGEVALCGGTGPKTDGGGNSAQVLRHFAEVTLKDGKNWPTSTEVSRTENAAGKEPKQNDNAKAVAGDLTKLSTEEKTIVAGLLAKTIEGGEVVEIRAVSSTSVMVNACYDLLSEGLGVVPYACVGLGGNFVGVVDGIHYTNHL
ncbi:P44/Msp2 family outer membrane protein [Anaplasma phagocytophilum str. Norway variant1]|uniref:P44/Msp2 family outer membrane protein n=1 Tax=Anaplasma phagocytophilum str. Norway variant1 TaxID=1392506 RepID=A0A7H9E0S2_ANAPH|nr:P44/Msp2 family outer membrane protein [Anaplasma phagocytophilum str. Norway variant1]